MPNSLQIESIATPRGKNLADAYRVMFLSARRGILIIGGETQQVLDANPAALALLDSPPEKVVGQSLRSVTVFCDLPNLQQVLQELPVTKSARYDEILITLKGGRTTFVDIAFHSYLVSSR